MTLIGPYINAFAFNHISYVFDTTSTFVECCLKAEMLVQHVSSI